MSNLTKFQDKLISELKGEFERINPREAESTSKRFSLDTINKCINEEDNFKKSIYSYNKTVIAKLKKQFFDEFLQLSKEFDDLIVFQNGEIVNNKYDGLLYWYAWDSFEAHYKDPQTSGVYTEIALINTNKKNTCNDSTADKFGGCEYIKLTCLFKTEDERFELESGKIIKLFKVLGLRYTTKNWIHASDANTIFGSTLDELIQIDKNLQQRIVELLK